MRLAHIDSDVGGLWIPASDGVMRNYIREHGTWEKDEAQVLRRLGRPHMVFLDIGASFGYFSRLIAQEFPTAHVHAFEPHPDIAAILDINTWEFGQQITVWSTALGSKPGSVGLTMHEHNIGDTRVGEGNSEYEVVAPVSRLDDLLDGTVDLVKMDTQGYELDILRGMPRIISTNRHMTILCEFYPKALYDRGQQPLNVLENMRRLGFSTALLRPEGVVAAGDLEIMRYASSGGQNGQATLILRVEPEQAAAL